MKIFLKILIVISIIMGKLSFNTHAQWSFNVDLEVVNITILSVTESAVTFSYTIQNRSFAPLPLSAFYYQNYVSTDPVYDSSDEPAGDSMLGSNLPKLFFNQTYTGTGQAEAGKLVTHPYLIVNFKILSNSDVNESNTSNNYESVCTLPDLVISDLQIKSIDHLRNGFVFSYTVRNDGWQPLPLNKMYFQTYVSSDPFYNPGFDKPAGGSVFPFADTLNRGQTFTGLWSNTGPSLNDYPYLIFMVKVWPDNLFEECIVGNNIKSQHISLPILPSEQVPMSSLTYGKEEKGYQVETGNVFLNYLGNYRIFNMQGQEVKQGTMTTKYGLPDLSTLSTGTYVFIAQNGTRHKFHLKN